MVRKLRWKFVAICMTLVTAVLAVVFGAVYFSVEQNIEDLSRQVLHRVIQEASMENRGGYAPEIGISIGGDRVLLPYFTVSVWGGSAYVTGGTYANLEDTEALQEILDTPQAQAIYHGFAARKAVTDLCRRCGYARRFK